MLSLGVFATKGYFAKLPALSRDAEEKRIIGRYFDVDAEGNIGANKGLIKELRKDVLETGSMMTSFTASWHPQGWRRQPMENTWNNLVNV